MKEDRYPEIKFTPAVYAEYCTIRKYDDGSGKEKYCIVQNICKNGESLAISMIAESESRDALWNYLHDNGAKYIDYFEHENNWIQG